MTLGTGGTIRFGYTGTGNTLATDGAASYSRDPAGDVIGVKTGQTGVLALTDQHTDVVGEFSATGTALAGSATYDPLGNAIASTNLVGNLGYQSGWTDHATGRVNMAARWYNPTTGQFDNRDSVGVSPLPNPMAANRYAYADDNPLTNTDPTGHCAINDDGDLCVGHRVVGGLPQTGPITTPTHNALRCTDGDCRVSPAPRAVTGTTTRTNPNHPNDASHKNSLISACAKICPYFGGANGILVTSAHRGSGEKYADEHTVLELMDWIPGIDHVVLTRDHDLYVEEGNDKAAESIETALLFGSADLTIGDGPAMLVETFTIRSTIRKAARNGAREAELPLIRQAEKAAAEEDRELLQQLRKTSHGNSPTSDPPPSGGRPAGGETPRSGSNTGSGHAGGSGGAPATSNAPARTTTVRHEPATVAAAPKNNAAAAHPALTGCHSFDPATPVLMADHTTKPIKDV
jgi:RHS repeat-associated protein